MSNNSSWVVLLLVLLPRGTGKANDAGLLLLLAASLTVGLHINGSNKGRSKTRSSRQAGVVRSHKVCVFLELSLIGTG